MMKPEHLCNGDILQDLSGRLCTLFRNEHTGDLYLIRGDDGPLGFTFEKLTGLSDGYIMQNFTPIDTSYQRDQKESAPDFLRPELRAFAHLMEAKLREKDAEYGGSSWKEAEVLDLHRDLANHTHKLWQRWAQHEHPQQTIRDAVDCGNLAMMIADLCSQLGPPHESGT